MEARNVLRSNGQNEAHAYAMLDVPPSRPEPPVDLERVHLRDPRRVPTAPIGAVLTGPRNPEQRVWPAPAPPGVDLPDALPATKAQRVLIDPDLIAQWRAEAKMEQSP